MTRMDNLQELLASVERAGGPDGASLGDVVAALGPRSFGPLLLVPSLVIVSPASAVPAVPSILAAVIGLIAAQIILGRETVWLPERLLRRRLSARQFRRTIDFLRPVLRRLDPFLNERLTVLSDRPGNIAALAICCAIAFFMPAMEFVPFMTSFMAGAIGLFAVGILVRDGLVMLLGYLMVTGGVSLVVATVEEIAKQ